MQRALDWKRNEKQLRDRACDTVAKYCKKFDVFKVVRKVRQFKKRVIDPCEL